VSRVAETQPVCSTTGSGSTRWSSRWSRATSPNSLITTAVLAKAGDASARWRSVVLPLPRKPVMMWTGITSRPRRGPPRIPGGGAGRGPADRRGTGPDARRCSTPPPAAAPARTVRFDCSARRRWRPSPGPRARAVTEFGWRARPASGDFGATPPALRPRTQSLPVDPSSALLARCPHTTHTWIGDSQRTGQTGDRPIVSGPRSSAARAAPRKIIGNLIECREAHARVPNDVMVDALQHHEHLRPAGHVRMDRHREDRIVVLAVDPIELVAPDLLEIARVHEPMAVGRRFDEHHGRQIVEVPARRDF